MRLVAFVVLLAACEDQGSKAREIDAAPAPSASADATTPTGDGCARSGSLDGVENDPSCTITRIPDEALRDVGKRLVLSASLEPDVVAPNAAAVLRVSITNVAPTEALVVLDLQPRPSGPRTDWSRIAGVPDTKPGALEIPRLFFLTSTLDAREKSVDAVPTVPGTNATPLPTKIVGIRVKPGGKIFHVGQWWAMRIPAPLPPVKDDAGHVFVPKTMPIALAPGDYSVSVDVPLHAIAPLERAAIAHIRVEALSKDH
jgi:hypothetical protein